MSTSTSSDVLVIAASNGYDRQLAKRFAALARQQGHSAALIDLTTIDLQLFIPRAQVAGKPPMLAELEAQLAASPRWVICSPRNTTVRSLLCSQSLSPGCRCKAATSGPCSTGDPGDHRHPSRGAVYGVLAAMRLQRAHLNAYVVGRQLSSNCCHYVMAYISPNHEHHTLRVDVQKFLNVT